MVMVTVEEAPLLLAAHRIMQGLGDGRARSEPTIGLLQQQHTGIAGDVTAVKCRFNRAAFTRWKVKRRLGTFCHRQSLARSQLEHVNLIELHGLCPFYSRNIAAKAL